MQAQLTRSHIADCKASGAPPANPALETNFEGKVRTGTTASSNGPRATLEGCVKVFKETNAKLAAAEVVFAQDGDLGAYYAAGEGFKEAHDAALLAIYFSE
jgi:hypothetical protein